MSWDRAKALVPAGLRGLVQRARWFRRNYRAINAQSTLFNATYGPPTYNHDGLCTSNNCDFIDEPRFARAYAVAAATLSRPDYPLQWRVHVVCSIADAVRSLPGDLVECGVNTGTYARAILEYLDLRNLGKTFHLLDTFDGLVQEQVSQAERDAGIDAYLTRYTDVYDQVVKTFAGHPVRIIRGAIPGSLSQCDAEHVCYLSIDMNCVAPEIAAAEHFWPRLVPGGVMVLDDYGFPMHIHQKRAFDRFAAERGLGVLSLPTGQGLLFKPRASDPG